MERGDIKLKLLKGWHCKLSILNKEKLLIFNSSVRNTDFLVESQESLGGALILSSLGGAGNGPQTIVASIPQEFWGNM